MARPRISRWATSIGLVVAPIVVASLWVPPLLHYYVPTLVVTDDLIARARANPSDERLAAAEPIVFLEEAYPKTKEETLRAAQGLLNGVLELEGQPPQQIHLPFDPRDLEVPSSSLQLAFAGLAVPAVLLRAYEITGEEKYFETAEAAIVGFAEYERRSFLPKGLQWNDHAVASNVQVLTEFWRVYRHHPSFRPEVARRVLALADRAGRLLAKPSQYTFATNHGIMQNLALLQFALVFPDLPGVDGYVKLATARLESQLPFFVSPEGIVLEHSVGYHALGTELLSGAVRYYELLGIPVPADWTEKLASAQKFVNLIQRPDGSLPQFGDTPGYVSVAVTDASAGTPRTLRADETARPRALTTFPVSGYAVLWAPSLTGDSSSETAMTWSNFDGHGHKHADELSVDLWAAGRQWWSNLGYWPYDSNLRTPATSWAGSSAPHRRGEDNVTLKTGEMHSSLRTSKLLAYGSGGDISAVEVRRETNGGYAVRRQVVQVGADLWIVADQHSGAGSGAGSGGRVVWNAAYDLKLDTTDRPQCYLLAPIDAAATMTTCFFASAGTEVSVRKGSTAPFAGWQVVGNHIVPSSAFVVDGQGDAPWLITVWLLSATGEQARATDVKLNSWQAPDHWSIDVGKDGQMRTVDRDGQEIGVHRPGGADERLALLEAPDSTAEIAKIRQAFVDAEHRYPIYHGELIDYRSRVSVWLLILWALQEAGLLALGRIWPAATLVCRWTATVAWVTGGAWLHLYYFVA